MKRSIRSLVFQVAVIAVVLNSPIIAAQDQVARMAPYKARLLNFRNPHWIQGHYVIRFRTDQELARLSALELRNAKTKPNLLPTTDSAAFSLSSSLARDSGSTLIETLRPDINGRRGLYVKDLSEAAARKLSSDARIESIEAVPTVQIDATQSTGYRGSFEINDPEFHVAPPHLDRLDEVTYPLSGTYTYYATGIGVDIWFLDTGIYAGHAEFSGGRADQSVVDCTVLNCAAVVGGINVNSHDPTEGDCYGHGTMVASVAAGAINGVAKRAHVKGVKVAEGCSLGGNAQHVVWGIRWVIEHHSGPTVINLSAHANAPYSELDNAAKAALQAGILIVSSSGNARLNACDLTPQRVAGVMAVGSSEPSTLYEAYNDATTDGMTSTSGVGPCISVFAEGTYLQAALADESIVEDTYCFSSFDDISGNDSHCQLAGGTSLATPQVTGLAALYLQTHPDATPAEVKSNIISAASNNMTGDLLGSPNRRVSSLVSGNNPTLDPNDGEGDRMILIMRFILGT